MNHIIGNKSGHSGRTTLLVKNVLASSLVKGWSAVVVLLMVPLTLNCLGTYQNGVWLTISSIFILSLYRAVSYLTPVFDFSTPLYLTASFASSSRVSILGISPMMFSFSQSIVMTSMLVIGASYSCLITPS